MSTIELRYAILGVAIYRVVNDRWVRGGQTIEDLIAVFNEYETNVVEEVVEALVGYGALVEVNGYYTVAPDASQ